MDRFEEHHAVFVAASRQEMSLGSQNFRWKKFPKLLTPEISAGYVKWFSFSCLFPYKMTISLKYSKKVFLKSNIPR